MSLISIKLLHNAPVRFLNHYFSFSVTSDESSDPEAVLGNDDENVTVPQGPSTDEPVRTPPEMPGQTFSERDDQRLPELTADTGHQLEASEDQVVNLGDSSEKDNRSKPETGNTETSEVQDMQDDNSTARNNVETSNQNDSTGADETAGNNIEVEQTNDEKNNEQKMSTDEAKDNS